MIPLYMPARNKFIQDVASPTLNDAISKSKKRKKITIPVRHATKSPNNLRINKMGKITRVPPMAELHYYRPRRTANPDRRLLPVLPWLPKKYVASKGLINDWHTAFKEVKLAAPVLISFTAVMLLALSWQLPEIKDYNQGHTRSVRSTSVGSSNPASNGSDANSGTKPATNPSVISMPATASAATVQPASSSQPVATPSAPTISTPPIDVVIPPVVDPGNTDPTPPGVDVPPIDVNTGIIDLQTPDLSISL